MCPPEHFALEYALNPWMQVGGTVDVARALAQWQSLRDTSVGLGHEVQVVAPCRGLPGLVFTANGGLVIEAGGGPTCCTLELR